ncbi:YciI family protein [Streptosporangium sp. G11]|uniref:YciI family protein n=1 Tax=Streptosporangium sp. G11 TaxID=3436926 RepID=UPI003EB8F104
MRYMATLKVTNRPDTPPSAELMEAIAKLGEEATRAGVLLDTGGLAPSAQGARIELTGGKLSVTDGPFAEAKELISYAIYQVRSKEEAVEWASRFVKIHRDHWEGWEGEGDLLRVFGPEDFAAPA